MASLFKRGKGKHVPYTIQYTDHEGKRRTVKGFTDKGLSEQLAAKLESEARLRSTGLIDPEQERQLNQKQTLLSDLLLLFQESLARTGRKYRQLTPARLRRVFDQCGFRTLGDLQLESTQRGLQELQAARQFGLGTYNHYQQALHAFGKWCVTTRRLPTNPLQGVPRANAELDVRHQRRALSPDELSRLIASAQSSPITVEGYTGAERVRIYTLAYMTGLRRSELGSLTPHHFQLDGEPPMLTVEAAFSKHRRKDVLPLHPDLVVVLRPWLATLGPEERLFPKLANRRTSKMVQHDLEQVGIPYKTRDGIADFHAAGRHTYITELLRNGTSLPEAKELARHADVSMTMRYTHIGLADQAKAIAKLPSLKIEALAAPTEYPNPPESSLTGPTESPALHQRCIPSVAPRPALSHSGNAADTNPRDNTQPAKTFGTVCRNLSPLGKMESASGPPAVSIWHAGACLRHYQTETGYRSIRDR